jgi:glutamyl-tRNA reductase
VTDALELVAVGLDHRTAGIELRERVAFTAAALPAALEQLTGPRDALLAQAAILSTCNRVEIYGAARSRAGHDELASLLAGCHGLDPRELVGAVHVHRGDEVPHHLAATAAGMHSLVVGEAQIQGQVRAALDHALAAGTAGTELRRLFESAIAAGRRVRTHTRIGRGLTSVPHASVELVRRRLGTLQHSTVLLIGAGTTGQLAATHLSRHGALDLLVLSRDIERAERLAQRHGGRAVHPERLTDALARCDVVISATGSPRPILRRDHIERARAGHTGPVPLLVLDLAVPRDVDPAVSCMPGVELYTIDDLRPLVEDALAQRRAELPAAHAVLRHEVARFTRWLSRREVAIAC